MSAEMQPIPEGKMIRFPVERVRSSNSGSSETAKISSEIRSKEKRKPYTFDLAEEHARVKIHGESYWKFFHKQVETYLKEAHARVKITTYDHDVIKTGEDEYRIVFGPGREDAARSYAIPANDERLPDWYRTRALADVRWAENINEKLKTAENGDVFVDMSPTAFDVSIEERKQWNMTNHSFIRLHRVIEHDGQKKLISQTPRHYLDLPEQVALFKQITGVDVQGTTLLGTVGKLNSELGLGHVLKLIDDLYERTPDERKLIPTNKDLDEDEVNKYLSEVETWARAVFDFMLQNKSRKDIVDHFQGMEKAFQKLVKGEKIVDLKKMRTRDFASKSVVSSSGVGGIMAAPYQAGASDCPGTGSGYGGESSGSGQMSYNNMSESGGGSVTENEKKLVKIARDIGSEADYLSIAEIKQRFPRDKFGERYFPCPECKMLNIRPAEKMIKKCLFTDCRSTKVSCETEENSSDLAA